MLLSNFTSLSFTKWSLAWKLFLEYDFLFFKKERWCLNTVSCALKVKQCRTEIVRNCFQIFSLLVFTSLEPLKVDMPEEKNTSSQQQQSTSKDVTEEELEDWLDSMIAWSSNFLIWIIEYSKHYVETWIFLYLLVISSLCMPNACFSLLALKILCNKNKFRSDWKLLKTNDIIREV